MSISLCHQEISRSNGKERKPNPGRKVICFTWHAQISACESIYFSLSVQRATSLAVTLLLKYPQGCKKNVVLCVVRVIALLCFSVLFVYLSPRLPTRSWESYLGFCKHLTLPIFARLFQQGGVTLRFTTLPRRPTFPCQIFGSNEIWLFHVTSGQQQHQIKETPPQFSFHIAAATVEGTCEYDFSFGMSHPASVSFMEVRATLPNLNAGAATDWHTRSATPPWDHVSSFIIMHFISHIIKHKICMLEQGAALT